ncbi:hypothetical protein [Natrinema sp. DC36]|uniref:hypothetical protein n=1 Tax=Natrinema sp. DC36 TaxID=2878680 RepID=UPI001CEFD4B7|nr:hypothetical protein [Natrinema sp. DC36]
MNDSDHKLQIGALELALEIQKENHDLVERVDAHNQSIHIVPKGNLTQTEREMLEDAAEEWVDGYPYTVSEWWPDRQNNEIPLVIGSYWPTGGQLSAEQLETYDEFVHSET